MNQHFATSAKLNNEGLSLLMQGCAQQSIAMLSKSIRVMKDAIKEIRETDDQVTFDHKADVSIVPLETAPDYNSPTAESPIVFAFHGGALGESTAPLYSASTIYNLAVAFGKVGTPSALRKSELLYQSTLMLLNRVNVSNRPASNASLVLHLAALCNLKQLVVNRCDHNDRLLCEIGTDVNRVVDQVEVDLLSEPAVQKLLLHISLTQCPIAAAAA